MPPTVSGIRLPEVSLACAASICGSAQRKAGFKLPGGMNLTSWSRNPSPGRPALAAANAFQYHSSAMAPSCRVAIRGNSLKRPVLWHNTAQPPWPKSATCSVICQCSARASGQFTWACQRPSLKIQWPIRFWRVLSGHRKRKIDVGIVVNCSNQDCGSRLRRTVA